MTIDFSYIMRIVNALYEAADRDGLRQFAKLQLGQDMDAISKDPNTKQRIMDLVTWAERNNRIYDLLRGFRFVRQTAAIQALFADVPCWQAYMETGDERFLSNRFVPSGTHGLYLSRSITEQCKSQGWFTAAKEGSVEVSIEWGDTLFFESGFQEVSSSDSVVVPLLMDMLLEDMEPCVLADGKDSGSWNIDEEFDVPF